MPVLYRKQLGLLLNILQAEFARDHNQAYELAMRALNRIINFYYTKSAENTTVEEVIKDESHFSHYDRFKNRLNLVRNLYKENPQAIEEGFQAAYKAIMASQKEYQDQLVHELGVKDVSMDELVIKLSEIFAGGFYSRLAHSYEQHLNDQDPMMSVACKLQPVLEAANPHSLPQLIQSGLSLYQKINEAKDLTPGHKKFLETLILVINEAIELLALRSKLVKSKLTESLDATQNDIFDSVDNYFRAYLTNKLASVDLRVAEDDNFFLKVLNLSQEQDLSPEKTAVCSALKDDIFDYFRVDGKPEGFGILNPRLLFDSETLIKHNQYQALKQNVEDKFLAEFAQTSGAGEQKRLSGGMLQDINASLATAWNYKSPAKSHIKRPFKQLGDGNPNSLQTQQDDAEALMGYFEGLAKTNSSPIDKFADALFALNQTLYLERPEKDDKALVKETALNTASALQANPATQIPTRLEKFAHHEFATSYRIIEPASQLHRDLRRIHYALRYFANHHADQLKFLLTQHAKITQQDLYYELNLSINHTISEITKRAYGFTSFPLSLLGKIRPGQRGDRERCLQTLTAKLMRCKEAGDYVSLFDSIINDWAEANRKLRHPWDGQFYRALQGLAKQVINMHVVSKQNFKLEFNLQQLRHMAIQMKCMNLREDKSYTALQEKITKLEAENAKHPDEWQVNKPAAVRPSEEELRAARKRLEDTRKVELFKNTLKGQLESQLLADLVISTGRFQIKDRDIGNIAAMVGDAVGKVQGLAGIGNIIKNVGHQQDEARQQNDASRARDTISAANGYLAWDQTAKLAVDKLCNMFAEHIKEMDSEKAPVRFAKFCFKRIHASLHASLLPQAELLSPVDRLVYAVFTQDEKLTRIPFRQDHYRRLGDQNRFTNTTFRGLVENVSFICETNTEQPSAHPRAQPEAPDQNGAIEPIQRQHQDLPVRPNKDRKLYVKPSAFQVKGEAQAARSQFSKYGAITGDVQLASVLRRTPLTLFDQRAQLGGCREVVKERFNAELAKTIQVKNKGNQTQDQMVRNLLTR